MDIGGWLRSLGLDQYEAAFRNNAIDETVLPSLTAEDLNDLGVTIVGHRRKLLDAIAVLRNGAKTKAPAQPAAEFDRTPRAGERRHLTVLFCDLVGSTEISSRLDAEEWHDIASDYHRRVEEVVGRFGGYLAKKYGDGAMVYFGYPLAQENDAERAVRSGLAIVEAVATQNHALAARNGPNLAVRVGIHAGSVVLDETADVFGEVPNVAARVQTAAEPGMVLITQNVHRLVSGLFIAIDRGAPTLKGVVGPVRLFQITRASGAHRRGAVGRAVTPLVGREEELLLLKSSLGPGARGAWSPGFASRRARTWQIAGDRGVPEPDRRVSTHLGRACMFAIVAEHAVPSVH